MSENKTVVKWFLAYLATVAAIVGGMWFFSAGVSEGAEARDTGVINDGTRICTFRQITPENVETFERYNRLIDKLEDVGIGGLTPAERMLGATLTLDNGCGTVAMDYRVFIFRIEGDYALFLFDIGYEFEVIRYLIKLSAFHADELL